MECETGSPFRRRRRRQEKNSTTYLMDTPYVNLRIAAHVRNVLAHQRDKGFFPHLALVLGHEMRMPVNVQVVDPAQSPIRHEMLNNGKLGAFDVHLQVQYIVVWTRHSFADETRQVQCGDCDDRVRGIVKNGGTPFSVLVAGQPPLLFFGGVIDSEWNVLSVGRPDSHGNVHL